MQVPLVDLAYQHEQIADEVQAGLTRVMREASFVLGADVAEFERRFASFVDAKHCVGVGNGTDALELVLRALGVGQGDEVILPANTFIASALAVARTGATPVLVDCDPEHLLIDPGLVEAKLSRRTRAIMPVHLYGQMAPLEDLASIASRANVPIVEDAAQAHGARRNGRTAGTIGLAAGVSFYPAKNLGAYGDAGAVLTRSDELARMIRALRNYGSDRKYQHPERGFNSRMDSLQAVVLNAKLPHLANWNSLRRQAAQRYHELLADLDWVRRPNTLADNEHVWHLYVVRVPNRDSVLARLQAAGIGAAIHYPVPIHRSGAFASLGHGPGSFPVAEATAEQILTLPLYPGITPEQQSRVVEVLGQV